MLAKPLTTNLSHAKLYSLISSFSGTGRPADDDPRPIGPHGPIIRQAMTDWLRSWIIFQHPEAIDGFIPHSPVFRDRLSLVALNPQPLPPRRSLLAALAEAIISRAELMHELVSATTTSDAEKRGIIIVSGYVGGVVRDLSQPGFTLPLVEFLSVRVSEGNRHGRARRSFRLPPLDRQVPVEDPVPPPPLEDSGWLSESLDATDLVTLGASFAQAAKRTFDLNLRRVFIDASATLAQAAAAVIPTTYRITVVTGSVENAGSDANVFVTLYGEQGNSGERQIDNFQDNHERGSTDVYSFETRDLGELQRIRIRHDNSGNKPGWFLDRIHIHNELTDEEFVFPCNRWLARDADDGQIDRTLDRS